MSNCYFISSLHVIDLYRWEYLQVRWFSFDPNVHREREQMCCYLTRTTAATHLLIKENLHETPTYGGWVESKGPRYCPSIEDKVHIRTYPVAWCFR